MHLFRVCGAIARSLVLVAIATSSFGGIATAAITEDGQGSSQNPPQSPSPPPGARSDFLFGQPHGSIGFRGSWIFARAGSDLFDFVTNQLTINRQDFNAPGIGVDVAVAIKPRLDVVGTFEFNRADKRSEYRDFVDNDLLPIEQTTELKTFTLGGSVRMPLTSRGHDVSRFAWVPRRFVPFVGAGAGVTYYSFTQQGDFVDFVDLSVFADYFAAKGWTPSVHAFGGIDMQIYRALFGTIEARYQWAQGELSRDFVDFDPIDLAGFRVSGGINLLF